MQLNAIDGWVGTGFKPGEMRSPAVVLRADGQWNVRRAGDEYGIRNAEGGRDDTTRVLIVHVADDMEYPYHASGAKMGQLIGKIGQDGAPFAVGKFYKFRKNLFSKVEKAAQLYLHINYPISETTNKEQVHGHLNVTFNDSDDKSPFEEVEYFDRIAGRYVRVS